MCVCVGGGFKSFFSMAKGRHFDEVLEVSPGPLTFTHLLPLPHLPEAKASVESGAWKQESGGFLLPKEFSLANDHMILPGWSLSQDSQHFKRSISLLNPRALLVFQEG